MNEIELALRQIASREGFELMPPIHFGNLYKSAGAKINYNGSEYWLKVSKLKNASLSALPFTPQILKTYTQTNIFGYLLEYTNSKPISSTPWLKSSISKTYIDALTSALRDIQGITSESLGMSEAYIHKQVRHFFTSTPQVDITEFTTTHGDMIWTNLGEPFFIFDPEYFGKSAKGLDEAMLVASTITEPITNNALRENFNEVLQTRQGKYLELFSVCELMYRYRHSKEFTSVSELFGRRANLLLNLL